MIAIVTPKWDIGETTLERTSYGRQEYLFTNSWHLPDFSSLSLFSCFFPLAILGNWYICAVPVLIPAFGSDLVLVPPWLGSYHVQTSEVDLTSCINHILCPQWQNFQHPSIFPSRPLFHYARSTAIYRWWERCILCQKAHTYETCQWVLVAAAICRSFASIHSP